MKEERNAVYRKAPGVGGGAGWKPVGNLRGRASKKPDRDFKDREDISEDYQIHLIYVIPQDGKDTVTKEAPHFAEDNHASDHERDLMNKSWEFPSQIDVNRDDYYAHGKEDLLDVSKSVFFEPRPEFPELPPDWHIAILMPIEDPKQAIKKVKSPPPTIWARTEIINLTDHPVKVFWIDYQGRPDGFQVVYPFDAYWKDKFKGHYFLVTDEADKVLALFRAEAPFGRGVVQ